MLTVAIKILVEEMEAKGAKTLGGEIKFRGKKYKLYLEEVE
jgi:hypothetical protein